MISCLATFASQSASLLPSWYMCLNCTLYLICFTIYLAAVTPGTNFLDGLYWRHMNHLTTCESPRIRIPSPTRRLSWLSATHWSASISATNSASLLVTHSGPYHLPCACFSTPPGSHTRNPPVPSFWADPPLKWTVVKPVKSFSPCGIQLVCAVGRNCKSWWVMTGGSRGSSA
jgi:hypothetical protein